ncbi:MAG: N-acetyltransferase family protein [Beijerinckiaceae bacterium]
MTTLRPYLPTDAELLAILMQASIEELAVDDYTEGQREAWAAVAEDEEGWAKKLAANLTLVALDDDGEPVGFAVLIQNRAIAHVHVHPDLVGMGIARQLCEALEKLALARGGDVLAVDATDNAKGFFEKLGYEAKARNTINYADEWLGATAMEKPLKAPQTATVQ